MPSKKNRYPIVSDKFYHIFNRGNNFETTFTNETDYYKFLSLIKYYLLPVSRILAYALLPNHFHLLIKTKIDLQYNEFSKAYSICILRYTHYINNKYNRSGSLFLNPFKRLPVESDEYLKRLVFYIHFNPQKHKFVNRYQTYRFTSFSAYYSNKPTMVDRQEIIEIFGSISNLNEYHKHFEELDKLKRYSLED